MVPTLMDELRSGVRTLSQMAAMLRSNPEFGSERTAAILSRWRESGAAKLIGAFAKSCPSSDKLSWTKGDCNVPPAFVQECLELSLLIESASVEMRAIKTDLELLANVTNADHGTISGCFFTGESFASTVSKAATTAGAFVVDDQELEFVQSNRSGGFETLPYTVAAARKADGTLAHATALPTHSSGQQSASIGRFPSFAPKGIFLNSGKWYYEVTIMADQIAQIGWSSKSYRGRSDGGLGVGDDPFSWGYDGRRVRKWFNGSHSWGRRWKEGDIVGVLCDLDTKVISFTLNGDSGSGMGVAFGNIGTVDSWVRPMFTIEDGAELKVNFGTTDVMRAMMKFKPAGYECVGNACLGSISTPNSSLRSSMPKVSEPEVAVVISARKERLADFPWTLQRDMALIALTTRSKAAVSAVSLPQFVNPNDSAVSPGTTAALQSFFGGHQMPQSVPNCGTLAAQAAAVEANPLDELYGSLHGMTTTELWNRMVCLIELNAAFIRLFPLMNLELHKNERYDVGSVARWLSSDAIRLRLLPSVRQEIWKKALRNSRIQSNPGRADVRIDRLGAAAVREKGNPLDRSNMLVFQQVHQQLRSQAAKLFGSLELGGQAWKANLSNFGAMDAGGPFRDSVSELCFELQSPASPLFVPCPNARTPDSEKAGNRHKFVLRSNNSAAPAPNARAQYYFFGQLMGMAVRSGVLLPIDLPSLFWKKLAGHPVDIEDVGAVDLSFANKMKYLRKEASDLAGVAQQIREGSWSVSHSVYLADGTLVELRPGADVVRPEELGEYIERCESIRLHDDDDVVGVIREGFGTTAPVGMAQVLSWQELETEVCGSPECSVEALKAAVRYGSGFNDRSPTIALFWRVMEEFTPAERSAWLRFSTGRARLPAYGGLSVTIQSMGGSGSALDNMLPTAGTCGQTFNLPLYETIEQARKNLRLAVVYGNDIDRG